MEEPETNDTPDAPAKPAKKKGGLMKTLVFVLLFLAAAGGGGAWWWLRGTPEAVAKEESSLEERGLLSFEPFLVNLTDAGGNRFLKANIELVLDSAEAAKHVEETPVVLMHLRSAILELLAQQSAPALVTPEGKAALKEAIRARTQPLVKDQKVLDVLFSEFVVQF
jgi:flagellar FliL protein